VWLRIGRAMAVEKRHEARARVRQEHGPTRAGDRVYGGQRVTGVGVEPAASMCAWAYMAGGEPGQGGVGGPYRLNSTTK
jgi:hypothetical protein